MPNPPAVFITGANGFVGSHLARALRAAGHPVRALIRKNADRSRVADLDLDWIEGDLNDRVALGRGCEGANWIIHVAGRIKAPDLEAYRAANVGGTVNLLDAAEKSGAPLERFVYISSQAAGGPASNGHPRTESEPNSPMTPYGISKLEGELAVLERAKKLPVTIVRPPAVYGPGDTEVLGFFQAVNWHIKPVFAHPPLRVSLVHVTDLVDGIMLAVASPRALGEIFYIAEDRHYDLSALEDLMQDALGIWAIRVRIPKALLLSIAGISEWVGKIGRFTPKLNRHKAHDFLQSDWTCSIAKAERELGYRCKIPFAEGAKQTVIWYRENGWL